MTENEHEIIKILIYSEPNKINRIFRNDTSGSAPIYISSSLYMAMSVLNSSFLVVEKFTTLLIVHIIGLMGNLFSAVLFLNFNLNEHSYTDISGKRDEINYSWAFTNSIYKTLQNNKKKRCFLTAYAGALRSLLFLAHDNLVHLRNYGL